MQHIIKAALISAATGFLILIAFDLYRPTSLFESSARTTYFVSMLAMIFTAMSMKKVFAYKTQSKIDFTAKHGELKDSLLSGLVVLLLFVSPMFDKSGTYALCNCEWIRWLGCLLMIDAIVFFTWSSWVFSKTFFNSTGKAVPLKLVKTGPYAVIRHPLYLGFIALAFSTTLVFNNYISLLLALVLTWILGIKAHDEEVFLELEFGEQWQAYKKRTFRFFPFIY